MSSILYEKSRSDFKAYFADPFEFAKPFQRYSLSSAAIDKSISPIRPAWDDGKAGIPLAWNKKDNTVLIDQGDSHTLVIGPTGSKKSRLIVMPAVRILANNIAKESMIICDPKAEIYIRTADYLKKQGYHILTLNLRSPLYGDTWNPLSIPYRFFKNGEIDRAYEFVNDIAENLMHSKTNSDPFWDNSASSFFFGLTLLLFKYSKDQEMQESAINLKNLINLRNELIKGPSRMNWLWNYAKTDPIIAASLIGTVETAKDTQGGILSVFDQKMRIFTVQPSLMELLSENSFDFDTVGENPTAIFLIVPDEKTGFHSLVSLFIKQSYEYIIYNAQQQQKDGINIGKLKRRLNYILDEFSSLPTITDFPAMITASRSRNIRFTLVIQSKHQLIQRYSDEAETILTNCNNWLFLTSREIQLLDEISKLCGDRNDGKPVIPASMLQRLSKEDGEVLLIAGREKPFIASLPDIKYYDHDSFLMPKTVKREFKPILDLEYVPPREYQLILDSEAEKRKNLFGEIFTDQGRNRDEQNECLGTD